jgi:hypothetical protein
MTRAGEQVKAGFLAGTMVGEGTIGAPIGRLDDPHPRKTGSEAEHKDVGQDAGDFVGASTGEQFAMGFVHSDEVRNGALLFAFEVGFLAKQGLRRLQRLECRLPAAPNLSVCQDVSRDAGGEQASNQQ